MHSFLIICMVPIFLTQNHLHQSIVNTEFRVDLMEAAVDELSVKKSVGVQCGESKCFARLQSDNQVGYLFPNQRAEGKFKTTDMLPVFNKTWLLAQQLQNDYNIYPLCCLSHLKKSKHPTTHYQRGGINWILGMCHFLLVDH